jgi:hypothetical protein
LDEHSSRNNDRQEDLDLALREKDEEIEVYKAGMDQALEELEELRLVSGDMDNIRCSHTDHVPL